MPDPAYCAGGLAASEDQASGLRRLFHGQQPRCTLVLTPALRSPLLAATLAARARAHVAAEGSTLVLDAARAQVGLALGLELRYDLQHVLAGERSLAQVCVAASCHLAVLPAARAVDAAGADLRHARRVSAAIATVARRWRHVLLVLPAGRAGWVRQLPLWMRQSPALIPVVAGGRAGAATLTAVRQGVSDAHIDTFHLLFSGMGEAAAARLLCGMAAIAQRHFGVRLLAAPLPAALSAPLAAVE